jgi:hypothetical protein
VTLLRQVVLGPQVRAGTTELDLAGRKLRFVPKQADQDGLVAVTFASSGAARADHILCGGRLSTVPA